MNNIKKKKILHILDSGAIGGKERALFQLFKALRNDEDYEIGVAFSKLSGLYADRIKELHIPIIDLDLKSGYRLNFNRDILHKMQEYDVHHFHDASVNQVLLSIVSGINIKRLITRRGGIINYRNRYGMVSGLKLSILKYLIKNYFQGYSGNSQNAADFVKKYFEINHKKIHILYNGIYFDFLKPSVNKNEIYNILNLKDSCFIVGTACHLWDLKRVDLLIRAFSNVNINNRMLLIFGEGIERDNLKKLVNSLNLEDKVIFVGEVKNMPDYYQILNCFVLASGIEESFGNAVVESMYSSVPTIIMNDSLGLKEHIADNVTGFVAKDEGDLARKIEYCHNNRNIVEEIARNGSKYVYCKYSIDNMVKSYKFFYHEVISK